jgi:hypothetical protein
VGYGIPEWFNHKSRNSFGRIQMHTDLGSDEWKGYALFIVYQVHEPDSYPKKRRKELVNQMKAYGEDMADRRIVEKILISLHEKLDHMVAVIEETKYLSSLGVQ